MGSTFTLILQVTKPRHEDDRETAQIYSCGKRRLPGCRSCFDFFEGRTRIPRKNQTLAGWIGPLLSPELSPDSSEVQESKSSGASWSRQPGGSVPRGGPKTTGSGLQAWVLIPGLGLALRPGYFTLRPQSLHQWNGDDQKVLELGWASLSHWGPTAHHDSGLGNFALGGDLLSPYPFLFKPSITALLFPVILPPLSDLWAARLLSQGLLLRQCHSRPRKSASPPHPGPDTMWVLVCT